jgi:hypothetical protein
MSGRELVVSGRGEGSDIFVSEGAWQRRGPLTYLLGMNYRTKAEFFIQGITKGAIDAPEVIAWADEVIVSAAKTEDWMIDISTCGPEDRLVVLSHLNTVKGQADQAELAALLKARGIE